MTTNRMLLLGLALLAGLTPVFARPPEVKLFGRKDSVLAAKLRADALAAMDAYLEQDDPAFSSLIEQVGNPYDYVPEVVEVAEPEETPAVRVAPRRPVAPPPVAGPVVYSDASVLDLIAARFAPQVRGTLTKGGISYLQLQGGRLLQAGTNLPVKIPQLNGQSFMLKLSAVNARGYTLQIGQAALSMPFNVLAGQSSGAIQRSPD